MLVRVGPDDIKVTGRTLHITEKMLNLAQPVTFTCIARNHMEMTNQQQHQKRMYRSADQTKTHEVNASVTFKVGKYMAWHNRTTNIHATVAHLASEPQFTRGQKTCSYWSCYVAVLSFIY